MGLPQKVMGSLLGALVVALHSLPAFAGNPAPGYVDTPAATGLTTPTAIAFLPDGKMLITEKAGALKLNDGGAISTLTTIPVCTGSEMGLLGIAIDPDYASNGYVYLYRTAPAPGGCGSSSGRFNEVTRVTLSGDPPAYVADSFIPLLGDIRTDNGNHDGGVLRIGPDDKLYVGVGDSGNGGTYSQQLDELNGKVLRLELDGSAPADNPYVGTVGARPELFAIGFRNPFRMSFDPISGSLWAGDVGQSTTEEIDIVVAGGNYRWPDCEGTAGSGCSGGSNVLPIYTYAHGPGASVTGGAFASSLFGANQGDYIFGDYVKSTIWRADVNGARDDIAGTPEEIVTNAAGPVDFVSGPDGAMYYVAINTGQVRRLAPAGGAPTDVDHYMCYRARLAPQQPKLPQGTAIDLEDQLDDAPLTFNVKREVSICNPARRDGSPFVEETVHQEGYLIQAARGTPRFERSDHLTVDAFTSQELTVQKPDSLLVPANEEIGAGGAPPYSGATVDHYKCYKVRRAQGSPKFVPPAPPTIVDQFHPGGQTFVVKKVTKLCNAVSADGGTIQHPASHLVCYQAKLPSGVRFTKQTVSTNNPDFGTDVLTVSAVSELCMPAVTDP